jgi:hypothetical protein
MCINSVFTLFSPGPLSFTQQRCRRRLAALAYARLGVWRKEEARCARLGSSQRFVKTRTEWDLTDNGDITSKHCLTLILTTSIPTWLYIYLNHLLSLSNKEFIYTAILNFQKVK